ncbi:MAG: hypothetical protein E7564_08720 [Ruminococcaceae bacterium]|nr:hypothetical protein [Oscillospiraceae bacterium]
MYYLNVVTRITALLLVLIMSVLFCACGGNENASVSKADSEASSEVAGENKEETTESETADIVPSKEELEAKAISFTEEDIHNAISNKALAASFVGKTYSFEGRVAEVKEDRVVLEFNIPITSGNYYMAGVNYICSEVYAPIEELIELKYTQRVKVVGTVNEVAEDSISWALQTYNVPAIIFKDAYIDPYYEVTATLKGINNGFEEKGAYNIKIGDNIVYDIVYFEKDTDLSGINTDGDEITILAKKMYEYGKYINGICYYDAILK